jgi:hypothetical protein
VSKDNISFICTGNCGECPSKVIFACVRIEKLLNRLVKKGNKLKFTKINKTSAFIEIERGK